MKRRSLLKVPFVAALVGLLPAAKAKALPPPPVPSHGSVYHGMSLSVGPKVIGRVLSYEPLPTERAQLPRLRLRVELWPEEFEIEGWAFEDLKKFESLVINEVFYKGKRLYRAYERFLTLDRVSSDIRDADGSVSATMTVKEHARIRVV